MSTDNTYDLDPESGEYAHSNDVYKLDAFIPQPSKVIDYFEDNNLNEYQSTDPIGVWHTKRSNAMGGEYLIEGSGFDTGYNSWCMSDGSLPNLPTRGDVFSFEWEARSSINDVDNSKFFIIWANQNASQHGIHDNYAIEHELAGDEIDIERDVNGTDISLGDAQVPFDNYTRYRSTIDFDSDGSGNIGLHILNLENGVEVANVQSSSDTTYDTGGIGFYVRHKLNIWIDNVKNESV